MYYSALQYLKIMLKAGLTHFMQMVSFFSSWKHQKTPGFPKFLEGMERDQCHETS